MPIRQWTRNTATGLLWMLLAVPALAQAIEIRSLHALLDTVLSTHVEEGYVDYPEISRNVRFHKYVEALGSVDPATLADDGARKAFWINAYNALAIKNVVDGITPISTLDRIKFFRTMEHPVGGRELDLNSIENILEDFDDPRIYFAIVNAAYTAPALHKRAYTAADIDAQLDAAVRRFVNDNRRNRFSSALRTARLSQLFEQRYDAFGDTDAALLEFISRYIDDPERAEALAKGNYKIKYFDWEWSINGRPM